MVKDHAKQKAILLFRKKEKGGLGGATVVILENNMHASATENLCQKHLDNNMVDWPNGIRGTKVCWRYLVLLNYVTLKVIFFLLVLTWYWQ